MYKLYQEQEEFGARNLFDTQTGLLTPLSETEYEQWKTRLPPEAVFEGNSPTHTRFPRRVYFQITRRCNLLCPYCFIKADARQHDLPLDTALRMAEYLGKNGVMEVRLTGGEPTLAEGFRTIVQAFRDAGVYISVATNGLWSGEILEYFRSKEDLWLIVSIDGDEEHHNRYRSRSYRQIVSNLKALREKNRRIRLRLNTVLTAETVACMESVFSLTAEVGAESVTFIPLRPQVREEGIRSKMLTAEQFQGAIRQMIGFSRRCGVPFTTTIETIYRDDIRPDVIFRKQSSCAAGREGTNLDFDFDRREFMVYGCSYSPASDPGADPRIREPFLAGSFSFDRPEDFGAVWDAEERWDIYRNLSNKSEDCAACPYYRRACTGSCPIQNLDYSRFNIQEDMLRQIRQQMRRNGEWYCYRDYIEQA